MGIDNPGEHQHVDLSCLGAQQRPRAGIDRGARCDRDRPICCWVGLTRRSTSEIICKPLCRSIDRASAPDWL
jgi:hypothetical protein